jgi:hypothetical protein
MNEFIVSLRCGDRKESVADNIIHFSIFPPKTHQSSIEYLNQLFHDQESSYEEQLHDIL